MDAVGVHPHGSNGVVGRDERDDLSGHADYLRGVTLVDLRSDTVTRPDAAMRRAMAEAEVGDDVYGEDPSINALEEHVAGMFGHAAAMFVPTGTMGNQTAIRLLCPAGDELHLRRGRAHRVLRGRRRGAARRPADPHPGRRAWPADPRAARAAAALRRLPHRADPGRRRRTNAQPRRWRRLPARAAQGDPRAHVVVQHLVALRRRADLERPGRERACRYTEYGAIFDTLSVCLSKGLGAPVGSVVVMADESMAVAARDIRHKLGGAMRQAGVLAAAGLHALTHNIERLAEDHAARAGLGDSARRRASRAWSTRKPSRPTSCRST